MIAFYQVVFWSGWWLLAPHVDLAGLWHRIAKLAVTHPDEPARTIHDGLIVRESFVAIAKSTIEERFLQAGDYLNQLQLNPEQVAGAPDRWMPWTISTTESNPKSLDAITAWIRQLFNSVRQHQQIQKLHACRKDTVETDSG